ncbi:AraC family transcriptional regulator [Paenibacillus koleovorans]|uniref:AraC family transcriptional regulator n=1 Tax=Paenibacillus koleovorans TaxID=121608 RepID=UPI000FD9D74B|nr:AraC family transcriptional regulator [Paenibacillus koleovorans]
MERGKLTQPERLLKEQFMELSKSFNIFLQQVSQPTPLHWHEFYEMCVILGGTGTNVVNGTAHRLTRGSLFLLTPADIHEIYPDDGGMLEIYNVIFSDEMLNEELKESLFYGRLEHMTVLDEATLQWIEQEYGLIERETRERRWGQRLIVKGALERIIIALLRQEEQPGSLSTSRTNLDTIGKVGHTAISRALIHIHNHFREPLTLEAAAREARLAAGYFSESFRIATGSTFQHYLQNLRLEFAASLLQASHLPITEICLASGFRTLTHFERVFKAKYGCSPRKYRS